MTTRLSKSKIISGLQCEKRLWLEVHQPAAGAPPTAEVQHRFDAGNRVNDIARALHENGHLIEVVDGDFVSAIADTRRVLAETPEKPVFEGTFFHRNVLVMADILTKGDAGYCLVEVKSSASVKAPHYPDCAVQAWVLEGAGVPLERVELAHINTDFMYGGDGDYRGLLHFEDMGDAIADHKSQVTRWVSRFQQVVEGQQPNIDTGDHCNSPYPCPFIEHCSAPGAQYPVTCLPRDNNKRVANALEAEGIHDIRDIPLGYLDNPIHEWVRRVTVSGKAELNPAAKKIIIAQPYPRYFLDFESIAFAVPIWKDTRPYQQLPFQWSCHIASASGELTHAEFLDTTGKPPMRSFTETLLRTVGDPGPIFVYSSFEKTCLNKLAKRFPDLADDIRLVIARLVDLLPVTRAHYYHPDMLGSWSLKSVLPTIARHLDYSDLGEVQDGVGAGIGYEEAIHPDTDPARVESLTADLRAYCKRDTKALVALVEFLATGKVVDGLNLDA